MDAVSGEVVPDTGEVAKIPAEAKAQVGPIPAKYLCKSCQCRTSGIVDNKIACTAADGKVEPILKKVISIREQCPHRKRAGVDLTLENIALSKPLLMELAEFARDNKGDTEAHWRYDAQLRASIKGEQRVTV